MIDLSTPLSGHTHGIIGKVVDFATGKGSISQTVHPDLDPSVVVVAYPPFGGTTDDTLVVFAFVEKVDDVVRSEIFEFAEHVFSFVLP